MSSPRLEERALHDHIRHRTVRLLDLTAKDKGGSGVLIRLFDRCFVATAAHVVPEGHDIQILVGEADQLNVATFNNRFRDDDADVAALEIPADSTGQLLRDFTEADQIAAKGVDQTENWCATLIGYPGQLIESTDQVSGDTLFRTHSFRTLALVTTTLRIQDWPNSNSLERPPAEVDRDIFLRFDQECGLMEQDLTSVDLNEKRSAIADVFLHGMSGCGIWLDQYRHDGIWMPKPVLAGIQTSAQHRAGWARGSTMKCWLEMMAAEITGIRDLLHA